MMTWWLALVGAWAAAAPAAPPDPPAVSSMTANAEPAESTVTVRGKNMPLAAFLESISRQAGVNFIVAEELEDVRVTAFLEGVTVREALELLRLTKGLTWRRTASDSATTVAPAGRGAPGRQTKVYTLRHAQVGAPEGPGVTSGSP